MSMNKTLTAAIAAVTIAAGSALVVPAMAQQAPVEVSETELDAFVVAYKDVVAIEQAYAERLQAAADEAEQQAIINEAQVEMTQAVKDAPDIGVDRYVEILQLAQNDPDLEAQLISKLQD